MQSLAINHNIAEIKQLHEEIWGHARGSFENAIRIGELLVAEKTRCGHSHWLDFARDNLPFDERTARNYMRLFNEKETILKSENVSDLILCEAYALLRKPKQLNEKTATVSTHAAAGKPKIIEVKSKVAPADSTRDHLPEPEEASEVHAPCTASATVGAGDTTIALEPPLGAPPAAAAAGADSEASAPAQVTGTKPDGKGAVKPATPPPAVVTESFRLADGSTLEVIWNPGVIPIQQVRDGLQDIVHEDKDAIAYLVEPQRFIVEAANFLNGLAGGSPSTATISNLNNAADWLRKTLTTILSARVR